MIRNIISNELFTILLMVGLVIIAIAKVTSPKRFNDFLYVLGNSKYLKIYSREQKFFDRFDALLFGNLLLSVSVFSYLFYQQITNTKGLSIDIMFKCAFGIGAFILIKVLIERLIGSLFEMDELIDQYLFQKISYKNYLGLLLVPINTLLLFTLEININIIYIVIVIIFIVNLVGVIITFKTHLNLIKHNFFYFILYLCTLEIAPYFILYKVFVDI